MYWTLDYHGCSSVARQKGLYRSIEDETLQPQEHLRRALLPQLAGGPSSVVVMDVVVWAIDAYSSSSVTVLEERRQGAIRYWSAKAELLPRCDDKPLHPALVKVMDKELDLFDRGRGTADVRLEPVHVAGCGASVTGMVAYDQGVWPLR